MTRFLLATLLGCAAGASESIPPSSVEQWPVAELGTPTGLVLAAAILRGSVPTIRVLHRREPSP